MLSWRAARTIFVRDAMALLYRENAIDARNGNFLGRASSRPMNFYRIDRSCVAETKVHAQVVGRGEAASAQHIATLNYLPGRYKNNRTYGIAWLARAADKPKLDPVVLITIYIAQQRWRGVEIVQHHIYLAVVEQVTKSRAPRRHDYGEPASLYRGH